ncbi:MAG: hypothetical protein IH571_04980, partial [Acholeplasmataceae bacterium]|nr:hypothetical protein [Acholeplasmataceae bacterium]
MRRKIRFGVIIFALAFVTILTLVFKDQQEAIYGYINSLYYIVVILIAMWYRKLLIPTVMYLIVLHVSVGFFALGTIPIQVVYELMLQLLIAIVMWFILKKRDVILNEYIGLISEMQLG